MKISIKDIPQAGLDFTKTLDLDSMGLNDADFSLDSPLEVMAHVECIVNTVTVKARVAVKFHTPCARCLEELERERCEDYTFNYMIEEGMTDVDLGDDIRQEIIIGIPQKVLCRDDCKGICPNCGVNLNNEKCSCTTSHKDTMSQSHKLV